MPDVKEIKLTLGELKVKESAIGNLLSCKLLSARTSYRMSKPLEKIIKALTRLEEHKIKLAEKYGEINGQVYTIKPENKDAWMKEFKDLLDEEIFLSFIPINLKEITDMEEQMKKADPSGNGLSTGDIMHLSDFIVDEGETKEV